MSKYYVGQEHGQSLLETALTLPIIVILLCGLLQLFEFVTLRVEVGETLTLVEHRLSRGLVQPPHPRTTMSLEITYKAVDSTVPEPAEVVCFRGEVSQFFTGNYCNSDTSLTLYTFALTTRVPVNLTPFGYLSSVKISRDILVHL